MKRKIIFLAVVVGLLSLAQAGIIGFGHGGGGGGSLQTVAADYPIVGRLKTTLNGLFDTGFYLDRDMDDPLGHWSGDAEVRIPAQAMRSLEVRPSDRPVRVLKLRNDGNGVTVIVDWRPRPAPDASWWDLTAKTFPGRQFELKPDTQQTLVVMKGGGTLVLSGKDDQSDATVEFSVDD